MKFKQEIIIFLLLVFLFFSISVVSATESLDDSSTDELVLLSTNNQLVDTIDDNVDTVQGNDSADLQKTAETDESTNEQNNLLGASNIKETPLRANVINLTGGSFTNIQNAINNLKNTGGTIYLNNATYIGTKDPITFNNINPIQIIGGTEENPNLMSTLNANNKNRIFSVSYRTVSIDHLIMTGGGNCDMGVIYVENGADFTLTNSIITKNAASSTAGLYIDSGVNTHNRYCTFRIENVTLSDNVAVKGANAAMRLWGVGTIKDCYFYHNYNGVNSNLLGRALQTYSSDPVNNPIIIDHCTFVNNGAIRPITTTSYTDLHAGAVCMYTNTICKNSIFINNSGTHGGAVSIHNDGTIKNCTFINNTAFQYGGALDTGLDTNINLKVNIIDCYFEGNQAPIGGAIQLKGDDIYINNTEFCNNSAIQGGACYLQGLRAFIENSNFTDNKASHDLRAPITPTTTVNSYLDEGGAIYIGKTSTGSSSDNAKILNSNFNSNNATNGAGIYVYGKNTNVTNSNFTDNCAIDGAGAYIIGLSATLKDNSFDNNTATEGAGVYIKGGNAQIIYSNFTGNNVSDKGGAVYIEGSNSEFIGNNFTVNNAIPELDKNNRPVNVDDGLGGAIYVKGNHTKTNENSFNHNTARNGSAIYTDGLDFQLTNDTFYHNQAYSYLLMTTAEPNVTYYKQKPVNITVVHRGGDNIINAIYNKADNTEIKFLNVSYTKTNQDGSDEQITTNPTSTVTPVNGVEASQNGTLLYQDSREAYQNITLKLYQSNWIQGGAIGSGNDPDGYYAGPFPVKDLGSNVTDIYGKVKLTLSDLSPNRENQGKIGYYTVTATHPEDWNYKYITNRTTFRVLQPNLTPDKTVSNETPYINSEIEYNLTITNDADAVYSDNINSKRVMSHV